MNYWSRWVNQPNFITPTNLIRGLTKNTVNSKINAVQTQLSCFSRWWRHSDSPQFLWASNESIQTRSARGRLMNINCTWLSFRTFMTFYSHYYLLLLCENNVCILMLSLLWQCKAFYHAIKNRTYHNQMNMNDLECILIILVSCQDGLGDGESLTLRHRKQ